MTTLTQRLPIMEPQQSAYKAHPFAKPTQMPPSPPTSYLNAQRPQQQAQKPRLPSISTLLASVPPLQQATPQPSPDLHGSFYRTSDVMSHCMTSSTSLASPAQSVRHSETSGTPSPLLSSRSLSFPPLQTQPILSTSAPVRPTLPSLRALSATGPTVSSWLAPQPPTSLPSLHRTSSGLPFARTPLPPFQSQPHTEPSAPTSPCSEHHSVVASETTPPPASPGISTVQSSLADRYTCPECQKTFSRPSSLRIHKHSHTGERPYVCTVTGCERAFSVRSNLRRHMKIH